MLKRNDSDESAAEFYERRRQWAEYISTHDGLTDRGFRVGFWLSRRMNGEDRCCWYSKARIAKEMNRNPRYVQRAITELRAANVMLVVEQKGRPNLYKIHAPFF